MGGPRYALPVAAALIAILAVAAGAPADVHTPVASPQAPTTRKLVVSATTVSSCTSRPAAPGAQGVSLTSWKAPSTATCRRA